MVLKGKGILAADESTGTMEKRLKVLMFPALKNRIKLQRSFIFSPIYEIKYKRRYSYLMKQLNKDNQWIDNTRTNKKKTVLYQELKLTKEQNN